MDAVELEFRESMAHRAEKGYILPGQMDVLFSAVSVAAGLEKMRVVNLSAMDGKNPIMKADQKFAVQARSLPSYNNSFDALVKDLKAYKKKATVFCCSPVRAPARNGWLKICGSRRSALFIRKILCGRYRPGR